MHDKQRFAALDWEDVHFFAALARHRTLPATARALQVGTEVVERRLARLEALLGYALFTQGSRGFELNAAGAAALAEAAQMEMAACSLLQKHPAAVTS
jgi:DNA-binding transcriptional LysR family regulator